MSQSQVLNELNSYQRVADYFDVSTRTVKRWVLKGEFGDPAAFWRRGGVVRIQREKVMAFAARHQAGAEVEVVDASQKKRQSRKPVPDIPVPARATAAEDRSMTRALDQLLRRRETASV